MKPPPSGGCNSPETCLDYFSAIEDPRKHNHNFRHNFSEILIIAILATLCGADGWVEIEQFGLSKWEWLKTFLELPNGIPSHDTFGRVFSLIDPTEFESCFMKWIDSLSIHHAA
ncbi:MAG: ISAs1 family transposase [Gammaproteobacteria bacterium]|nr:ISAs1 family transposase [Gammaproteobacteria bacterium]